MIGTPISLLIRLRSDAGEADWQRFVSIFDPFVRGWIRRSQVSDQDTDDVVQEVFAALVRELPKFSHSGQSGAFRTWLRLFVTHRVLHFIRIRRPSQLTDEWMAQFEDGDSELVRAWDAEHDAHVLRKLMELAEPSFAATSWAAFRMLALENQPAASVAARLGITENAALIAKSRIMRRLRCEAMGLIDQAEL